MPLVVPHAGGFVTSMQAGVFNVGQQPLEHAVAGHVFTPVYKKHSLANTLSNIKPQNTPVSV